MQYNNQGYQGSAANGGQGGQGGQGGGNPYMQGQMMPMGGMGQMGNLQGMSMMQQQYMNNMGGFGGGRGGGQGGQGGGGMGRRERPTQNRNNDIGDSSPVVHLRNVTPEVSQLSIQNTIQSFGRIRNIVMLRQKNQALIEMESVNNAQQLVDFFKDPGYVEIDGRRVYVRYSLHTELTATQHSSKTLLVSMFNTQYDVSAAAQISPTIVYQIFGNYGTVERIVVLPKNESSVQNHNRVQALVQFETKESAQSVKNILQGQPVTLGDTVTFTLDIQFSRMEEIKTSSPHNSLVIPRPGQAPQQGSAPDGSATWDAQQGPPPQPATTSQPGQETPAAAQE